MVVVDATITSNGSLSSKLEQVGHIPTSSCASIPLPSGTCVDGRSSSLNSGAESSSKDSHQGSGTCVDGRSSSLNSGAESSSKDSHQGSGTCVDGRSSSLNSGAESSSKDSHQGSGTCVDGRSSSLNSGAESSSKDSHQGRTTTPSDPNSRGTSSESKSQRVPQSFTKPPQRTTASESHAGTGAASDAVIPTAASESHAGTGATSDAVIRVTALLQRICVVTEQMIGHVAGAGTEDVRARKGERDRRKTHVPKIMAMLCTRLGVSWACLTCVTPTGTYMQHTGAAFGTECSQPTRFMFDNGRAQNVSHGGYGGYHSQIGRGSSYRGTVSRQSSTSSVNQFPVEIGRGSSYRGTVLRQSSTSSVNHFPVEATVATGVYGSHSQIGRGSSYRGPVSRQSSTSSVNHFPVEIGRGSSYRGTVLRQSSTSSVNHFPVEVPCCEAYPVKGSSSSVELMLKFKKMLSGIAYTHSDNSNSTDREGVNPSRLSRSQHPDLLVSGEDNEKVWVEGEVQGSRLFSSSMGGTLPKDWRQVARDKGLRSMLCCPVYSSSDPTTIVGCLSFGMMEAVAWKEVWWYSSMLLITGWAASAITESRFVARACMFERLLGAETINELAASVVYGIPNFLKDVSLGQVEARLALVSSTLSQAIVYVQPQVNHVST
eukprot:gene11026-18627_t